jgi:hypothetical protein
MGGGKERKINGGSANADQVKDSALKTVLSKKLSAQCDAKYLGLPGIK